MKGTIEGEFISIRFGQFDSEEGSKVDWSRLLVLIRDFQNVADE